MKLRNFMAVFLVLAFASGLACSKPVATVNGKKIEKEEFEMLLRERVQAHQSEGATVDPGRLRDVVLQELIGEQLILAEAERQGIRVSDQEVTTQIDAFRKKLGEEAFQKGLRDKGLTFEQYKARMVKKLTVGRFLASLVPDSAVTEEEMLRSYQESPRPFVKTARVNMRLIEFASEDAARSALEEMRKTGIEFDDFAAKVAAERTASVTDYGWVNPDTFSPEMSLRLKDLRTGKVGGPYKGKSTYYIVRIKDREKEGIAPYEEVKNSIRAALIDQKRQAAVAQWLEEKKKTSAIVISMK